MTTTVSWCWPYVAPEYARTSAPCPGSAEAARDQVGGWASAPAGRLGMRNGAATRAGHGERAELTHVVAVRIPLDLRVLAGVVRGAARGQEPYRTAAQPQGALDEAPDRSARGLVAEGAQQRLVEEGEAQAPHGGGDRRRVPGGHEVEGGVGDLAGAFVPAEVGLLVGVEGGFELLVGARDVRDAQVAAECGVVVRAGPALVMGQRTPAVGVQPACRNHHEGAQDVPHVLVRDVVAAVHLVDAADGGACGVALEAVLDDRVQEQRGVVVALLGPVGELGRLGQQATDARDGICPEQGEFQGAGEVPGELVGGGEPVDGEEILVGIETEDLPQPIVTLHRVSLSVAGSQLYVQVAALEIVSRKLSTGGLPAG